MNKIKSFFKFISILLLVFSSLSFILPINNVHALDGSSFIPGRIIDDFTFTNKNSMTVSQIQAFLDSKIPTCDTWGTLPYAGTTRAAYAAASPSGNTTPFICLNQYYENPNLTYPVTHTYTNTSGQTVNTVYNYHQNNYYQIIGFTTIYVNNDPLQGISVVRPIYQNKNGVIPTGAISAAQIIWNVAQIYNINPQTLIVLLQKEQGLVTDDWAWAVQYEKATGYMCPDSAPCNPALAGFYNQVDAAGWQYRNDLNGIGTPGFYSPYELGWNNILYSPNTACGTKVVYIQNLSTASLYRYTPYTPNDAALANLYGTGDACSSYGNRNFWRYFNDWFGSTIGPYYYFNSAINPPTQLPYGATADAELKIVNNSTEIWYSDGNTIEGKGPYRIMTRGYINSNFADTTDPAWLGTRNQIRMVEASVAPGETATFQFRVKAPQYSIAYEELNMTLVQDGVQVYQDLGLQFRLSSIPDYSYLLADATVTGGLLPGDMYQLIIKVKNTGTKSWFSDSNLSEENPHPIRMATKYYINTPYASPKLDSAWLGTSNQIKMLEAEVAPGGIGTFKALLTAPYRQVNGHRHDFQLVLDGVKFLPGSSMVVTTSTPTPNPDYEFVSALNPPLTMSPDEEANVYIKIKNTGNMIWRSFDRIIQPNDVILRDIRLITAVPGYRLSLFANTADSNWLNTANQVRMKEPIVGPGQVATFEFSLKAPAIENDYLEYFMFAVDGYFVLKDIGLGYPVSVR